MPFLSSKAQFGGGAGTSFEPYWIENATHLNNIRLTDDEGFYLYLDNAFIQLADIDLGEPPWNVDDGWEPIGTGDHPFTGYYDGNDFSIDNLYINRPFETNIGLFGVVAGADLYDIELVDVMIEGGDNTGALAGSFLANSVVNEISETLIQTFSSGSVAGNHQVGGLIGYSDNSLIRKSHSTCTVEGFDFVGGLIGRFDESVVEESYASGSIEGNNDNVGGLTGRAYESEINECYADCSVEMTGFGSKTGGLVGYLYSNSVALNCYSTGSVIGEGTIGGLTGYNHGSTVTNCYAVCTVSGSGGYVGGLAGRSDGTLTGSYWDMTVSGLGEPGLGDGRTTEEMTYPYSENTYILWNFDIIWVEDPDIGFGQYNNGYPYLDFQHNPQQYGFAGGSGTEADPYQISHASHLNSVRNHLNVWFIQIADVELGVAPWNEESGWLPIGSNGFTTKFEGNYDGAGYTISGLTINNVPGNYCGLFGVTHDASLSGIRLTGADITGNDYLGGIAGKTENTEITDCFVSGNLAGGEYVGGLTGETYNYSDLNISSCETDVIISAEQYAGGLAGMVTNAIITACNTNGMVETSGSYVGGLTAYPVGCEITGCSSGASVSGSTFVGGLTGIQSNTMIARCFTTGNISGGQNTGGLVGLNWSGCAISDSYSRSMVTGNSTYLGGFAGSHPSGNSISNCYSTGVVNGLTASQGFIGQGGGIVTNSFWDIESSGDASTNGGGTGRSTEEMKSLPGYTDESVPGLSMAWDFTGNPLDDESDNDYWDLDGTCNDGYPYFSFLKTRFNWTGSINTSPATPGNWNTGSVPLPTDNILILSSASNNMVVNNAPASPLVFNSMLIQSGATVSINPGKAFTITGYIHNEGTLGLNCNETGSASFIDSYSGSQINFSGTGEAVVGLYLEENQWHYVSSPVSDALSGVFLDIYLKGFDEETGTWEYIIETDVLLHPMIGYAAYPSDLLTGSTTVFFTGRLNSGSCSATLTNHSSAVHNHKGFNMVGNPYPSAVNWQLDASSWTRDNIDPTIYLWNPVAGQYGVYNRVTKIGTHDVDSIIPAKQGFFVHVTEDGTGTLGITNNSRLHHDKEFFKSCELAETIDLIKLKAHGNGYSDETIIYFDDNAGYSFDPLYDALKIKGLFEAPQLFTKTTQDNLAINALKEITEKLSVPLYFEAGVPSVYTITAENTASFDLEISIYLEDRLEGCFQNLRTDTTYCFSSVPDDDNNRFFIHFFEPDQGNIQIPDTSGIFIYTKNGEVVVEIPDGENGTASITDLAGRLLITAELTGIKTHFTGLPDSFIIVSVKTASAFKTGKLILNRNK
jgi:hypothetical protein